MVETYVFDFYNLYLPRKYINKQFGITIFPLKFADEFENNRKKMSSKYRRYGWKIAKCHIKSNSNDNATKIAYWLELLYSFAQNRSVFFIDWYPYKRGRKYSSYQSKYIVHRENRFSDLVYGTFIGGARYSRDISFFIDNSLDTFEESKDDDLNEIITTISAYNISRSELAFELKFLISWIALEKLANSYYKVYKSNQSLFEKSERFFIKNELESTLNNILKDDKRLNQLKKSLSRNFLYEHDTFNKMSIYLHQLDLGFDKKELDGLLKKFIEIRKGLVHDLNSTLLNKNPQYLNQLRKIFEQIILRYLGISKEKEKKLFLHQVDKPLKLK